MKYALFLGLILSGATWVEAEEGIVIRFNADKGYGFIDSKQGEVFVDRSEIQTEGHPLLKKGQKVEFQVVEGKRGPAAKQVKIVDNR